MTAVPQVGDRAPGLALPDHTGSIWRLDDALARGSQVVLVFLRHLG